MYTKLEEDYENASTHMLRLNAILEGTKELVASVSKRQDLSTEDRLLCTQIAKLQTDIDENYNQVIQFIRSNNNDGMKAEEHTNTVVNGLNEEATSNGNGIVNQARVSKRNK